MPAEKEGLGNGFCEAPQMFHTRERELSYQQSHGKLGKQLLTSLTNIARLDRYSGTLEYSRTSPNGIVRGYLQHENISY